MSEPNVEPPCDARLLVEIARLDERMKAMDRASERSERSNQRAIEVAASELSRRLDILNHAHQEALRVQQTYVPRETFEVAEKRVSGIEQEMSEWKGRLWLPLVVVAGLAAGLAAALVKLLIP